MAEFLTLNGFQIPVSARGVAGEPDEEGDRARAFSGRMLSTRRYRREEYTLSTPPLIKAEAEALRGLIRGDGHYWSFDDDLYSAKGLGPQAGLDATQSDSGGKYGGKVSVNSLAFSANLGNVWTVLVYRYFSAWEYFAVRSDGAKWQDGIRNDLLDTSWLSVVNGDVILTGTDTDYDELVALPYLGTVAMVEAFMALDEPFGRLPRLKASGDMLPRDMQVEGAVESISYTKMADGVRQTTGFRLMEV